MGRHTAPDGEGAGVGVAELLRRSGISTAPAAGRAGRRSRHGAADAVEEPATQDVAVEDVAVEDVAVEDVAVEDVAVEDVAVEDVDVTDLPVADVAVEDLLVADLATQETVRIVPPEPDTAPLQAAAEVTAAPPASEEAPAAPERPEVTSPAPPAPARAPGGTHADLALLRTDATLRARCAAAVVVPFVLYTVVLLAIGRVDVYLLWVWIPTVTAGVLVGTFLDLAHRRLDRS